jgi:hypothetical protein
LATYPIYDIQQLKGKVSRDATERDLKKLFSEFGRIREVKVLTGFAFVEFDDSRDARDAVDKLDGARLLGERYGFVFENCKCIPLSLSVILRLSLSLILDSLSSPPNLTLETAATVVTVTNQKNHLAALASTGR